MVATSARIGFVTQEYRTVVASDAAVQTNYGKMARDTKDEPIESFFELTADAQSMVNERHTLLKADRRRFRQDVNRIVSFTGSLDFSQVTPAVTVTDAERAANHNAAIVEIAVRHGDEKTTIVSWG